MNKALIIIFFCSALFCFGQKDTCHYKNFVAINVTELVVDDIRISYEHPLYKRHKMDIEAGYQPGILCYSNEEFNWFDNVNLYTYKGYNFSLGYKFYFKSRYVYNMNYLSVIGAYGRKYRNNFLNISGGDGLLEYKLTDASQVYKELKIVFGEIYITKFKKKVCPYVEGYVGVGALERKSEVIIKGGGIEYNIYHNVSQVHISYLQKPYVYNYEKLRPEFCLGFKLGFAF